MVIRSQHRPILGSLGSWEVFLCWEAHCDGAARCLALQEWPSLFILKMDFCSVLYRQTTLWATYGLCTTPKSHVSLKQKRLGCKRQGTFRTENDPEPKAPPVDPAPPQCRHVSFFEKSTFFSVLCWIWFKSESRRSIFLMLFPRQSGVQRRV